MKKNYNPYTVPEGFFEESRRRALDSYARRARTLKYAFLSAAAVVLMLAIPVFVRQQAGAKDTVRKEYAANNLAGMYDYDIFLQVNF